MLTKITTAALLLFSSSLALAQGREGNADADHDGKVTKQEFLDARAEQAAKLFDRLDANHDGALDTREQEAARSAAGRFRDRRQQ